MKRIVISIIVALAIFAIGNAAGAHAGEVFNEDVTISDAVISQGEYEGALIRGNLTINCTVVGQQAFKDAIIVGDVTINAKIISQEAFKDAVIGGTRTVNDDASVDDTAFASKYEGKITTGDLVLDGYLSVGREKYKGKVIIGDVTIKRTFAFSASFYETIVVGNLNIERVVADESSFRATKVTGDLDIKRTIGFNYSFDNITVYGEKRIDEKSQFMSRSCPASYWESDADDITFKNRSINRYEYIGHIFYGDLILDNSVAQNLAFPNSIILGDVFFKNSVAYKDAFYLTNVLGDFIADDKSYLEWNATDSESHAGETFESDVVITDALVVSEQYKGATFMGDLIIESTFIGNQAFENAIILGDLTVRSLKVLSQAFKNAVVSGKVAIEEPTETIDSEAFSGILSAIPEFSFPSSLQRIGAQAFRGVHFSELVLVGCHNLKIIEEGAFYNCSWERLVLPVTENHLTISQLAFYRPHNSGSSSEARTILMPQHINRNLEYGTPYLDEYGDDFGLDIEDIITPNDIVYLWLDPNNIKGLWETNGNGRLTVKEQGSDLEVTGFPYSYNPTVQSYGTGYLYVPKGCKQKLIDYLKPFKYEPLDDSDGRFPPDPYYFIPIYSYFKDENIIEIDMGEYPNYSMDCIGDLNGDGSVDGGDVSILLEMVLAGGLTDEQKAVADLNGDGDVDGGDVSILLEMVLSGE